MKKRDVKSKGTDMKRIFHVAAAALLAFGLPAAAHSQMVVARDPGTLVSAMRAADYEAEAVRDSDGMVSINSKASSTEFQIYFFGCRSNVNCLSVQFFATYRRHPKMTLQWINDWNSRNRYVRTYVSPKGAMRVEMDLDLDAGGMSRALFRSYLDTWAIQLAMFEAEMSGR